MNRCWCPDELTANTAIVCVFVLRLRTPTNFKADFAWPKSSGKCDSSISVAAPIRKLKECETHRNRTLRPHAELFVPSYGMELVPTTWAFAPSICLCRVLCINKTCQTPNGKSYRRRIRSGFLLWLKKDTLADTLHVGESLSSGGLLVKKGFP